VESETINDRLLAAAGRFSYREIGDMTGIHPETVRRYMNGDPPSAEFLATFCAGMGISVDWMLFGQGSMSSASAIRQSLALVSEGALFAGLAATIRGAPLRTPEQGSDADDGRGLDRGTTPAAHRPDPHCI
jgi:hypothetical protein